MTINLHHLELFYHVARCRGIAEAVRGMPYGIQQPAISEQMLLLEEELGVNLFERRPFRLTSEGRFLYESVRTGLDEMLRRYETLRRRKKRSLRLAAEEGLEQSLLLPAIAPLQQLDPSAEIILRSGTASQLRQALEDREIDLAIICAPEGGGWTSGAGGRHAVGQVADLAPGHRPDLQPDVRSQKPAKGLRHPSSAVGHPVSGRVLATAPLALLIPAASAIQTADHFWTQKTIAEQLITPDAAHAVCQAFDHGLKHGGLDWPARMDVGSIACVAPLVAAGLGIGLIPNLPNLTRAAGVHVLSLAGFEPVAIACLWRTAETRSLQAAIRIIQQRFSTVWPEAGDRTPDG